MSGRSNWTIPRPLPPPACRADAPQEHATILCAISSVHASPLTDSWTVTLSWSCQQSIRSSRLLRPQFEFRPHFSLLDSSSPPPAPLRWANVALCPDGLGEAGHLSQHRLAAQDAHPRLARCCLVLPTRVTHRHELPVT
eukprot:3196519-Amphidinium_carterae.1